MKWIAVYFCALALLLGQVANAQLTGWVLWIGLGDHTGFYSWLIADAFEAFAGCQNSLDAQAAVFLRDYPKEMYDVQVASRNAVRTIDATEILTDEQARKKRESFAKNQYLRGLSEEALEKMSKQGDKKRTQIICLPGGTTPQIRAKSP